VEDIVDIAIILYGDIPTSITGIENKLVEKFNATVFKHFSVNKFHSMRIACHMKSMYEAHRLRAFNVCLVVDIEQIQLIDYLNTDLKESTHLSFLKGSSNNYNEVVVDPAIFYANSLITNRACEYVNFSDISFYEYLKMQYIQTKCLVPLGSELFVRTL
jgi:hypothetical protein